MNGYLAAGAVNLRLFEASDAEGLRAYLNMTELLGCRYVPGDRPDLPLTAQEVDGILQEFGKTRRRLHLAVVLVETGALIGHTSAYWGWDSHCPDVNVVIAPEHQRKGLGSAVLKFMIGWLYANLPAHNISGYAADWNTAAHSFMAAHGFKLAGRSRRESMRQGRFVDEVVMDILRPEWEARDGA